MYSLDLGLDSVRGRGQIHVALGGGGGGGEGSGSMPLRHHVLCFE